MSTERTTEAFLLEQLSEPGFHPGDKLGEKLGISRVAISKHMSALRKKGLPLISVAGKGYRLEEGTVLLDQEAISARLAANNAPMPAAIHIHQQLASTNAWLLEQAFFLNQAVLCLTESQPAGRGRRERQWHSSPYRNLLYSLSWRFGNWPGSLSAISLLAGLAVAESLEICGVEQVQIKWPNDIYLQGKKLGGLLVSAKGEASGACDLVIGVGINHRLLDTDAAHIDQDWTDLHSQGYQLDRNQLAALISEAFIDLLPKFEQQGFAPFRDAWNARGLYRNEKVRIFTSSGGETEEVQGTCLGVDEQGVLHLQKEDGEDIAIRDADLSMRPLPAG